MTPVGTRTRRRLAAGDTIVATRSARAAPVSSGEPARHQHLLGLTLAMLRYRVAIMVWTFMLLGAAAGDGARLDAARLALAGCALGWSYVAATTVNDLADVQIDLVNHPNDQGRPLVTGAAASSDMRRLHWAGWVGALAFAAPLGPAPALMVLIGLVIGRAYSSHPLRLSYRPYLAPLTLAMAYVAIPYGLGLWSSGHVPGVRAVILGAGLAALFLARIILKDFRDREGDAIFGRRSILLVHGKGATCVLSGVLVSTGDLLLCLALGPVVAFARCGPGLLRHDRHDAVAAVEGFGAAHRAGGHRYRGQDGERPLAVPCLVAPRPGARCDLRYGHGISGRHDGPVRSVLPDLGEAPGKCRNWLQGLTAHRDRGRRAPPNAHATISGNSPRHSALAVRRDPLAHHDVRTCIAQRDRPPGRVVEEERLQRAGDEVHARNRTRHHAGRLVTRRPASRRRPHRRRPDAEAQGRARALHPPRHRTPRCVRRAARLRTATAPIGGRPRRKTSHVPRTVPRQRPVSTPGAAASHRPARVHRRSSWAVRRPPRGTRPTARSPDRHRRTRLPRADPAGRTP